MREGYKRETQRQSHNRKGIPHKAKLYIIKQIEVEGILKWAIFPIKVEAAEELHTNTHIYVCIYIYIYIYTFI